MIIKLKGVQKSYEQVNEWVKNLMKCYEFKDHNEAFALLKATLCTLRDRLPTDEAVHLGQQLPVLLRGYYYDGWDNNKNPTGEKSAEEFFYSIRSHLMGYQDLPLEEAAAATMKFVLERIDQGEAKDVRSNLPPNIVQITL